MTTATGTGHLQKGHGVAFGDLNGDGREDIYLNVGGFVPGDSYNKALFANPGSRNKFITLRLRGTKSNRAAIGAQITLTLTDSRGHKALRYREVSSGGSFGASTLAQEIGLGDARRIDSVEIEWPVSRTRQTFRNLALNRTFEIIEGGGDLRELPAQTFAWPVVRDTISNPEAKVKAAPAPR